MPKRKRAVSRAKEQATALAWIRHSPLRPWGALLDALPKRECCVAREDDVWYELDPGDNDWPPVALEPTGCPRCDAMYAYALGWVMSEENSRSRETALRSAVQEKGPIYNYVEVAKWLGEDYPHESGDARRLRKLGPVESPFGTLHSFEVDTQENLFRCTREAFGGATATIEGSWEFFKKTARKAREPRK